ncbi:MAG: hypothetical protein DWQ07_02495 [Chloroflexi bacterium]|nr:MAG: hypothetical protein DWQ07_02495 [Chloroflexota bacterium]MBL1193631.1 hypothetical protein [Chloroflexota bacterium]NOH10923.1 hypothetical protein [Chloroflexota bacterium]
MEVLAIILGILMSAATLIALFLVIGALFPNFTDNMREAVENSQGRTFILGLVNFFFFGVISVVFIAIAENSGFQILAVPGVLALVFLTVSALFGLTGIVQLLGERLFPDHNKLRRNIYGSAVLILGSLTPYVGWFGLALYLTVLAFGAFLLGLFNRLRKPSAAKIGEEDSKKK